MKLPGICTFEHSSRINLKTHHLENYSGITVTRFLGVDYLHIKCNDGGDLYVTQHGIPFIEHIKPENWYERVWFKTHREKLKGTSTIYKVTSKRIKRRSVDLIAKWSRVGQYVPLETKIIEDVLNAEFNSPFEEFALVEELRGTIYEHGDPNLNISLQKPLGIYVPPEKLQLWQTGRSKHKIKSKLAKHPGVEIDILRQYILIYKWVKGVDAVAAFKRVGIPDAKLEKFTHKVTEDLRQDGFRVLDQKPVHYIIRLRPDGTIMKNKKDDIPFALVDFELLQRTPEHEEKTRKARRADYLARQRDPFKKDLNKEWPPYLHSVTIMGVDYVWGIAESTNGMLWVVGDDPDLFDYFLPERWRKTPQTKLSSNNDIYYTKTKDDINIVWKVSRVGERPDVSPDDRGEIVAHGCNSPFEKFAIAFELSRKGIDIVYPRAIYMTGNPSESPESIQDKSRFKSHSLIHTPTGESVLREDHDYITIWGFWRGLDASMAKRDIGYLTRQNAFNMFRRHLITEQEFLELMDRVKRLLFKHGYENLTLKGNHVLLSLNPQGGLLCDVKGKPAFRLCNFEFIKKL